MIDHISIAVQDAERSRLFYDSVLGVLGYRRAHDMEIDGYVAVGWGEGDAQLEPGFWIGACKVPGERPPVPIGQHIAFRARSRTLVDAFHAAGLAAGGTDNGAPGLRPHYHAHYYAAFLIDPDGHHLEAVCHLPG